MNKGVMISQSMTEIAIIVIIFYMSIVHWPYSNCVRKRQPRMSIEIVILTHSSRYVYINHCMFVRDIGLPCE